MHGAFFSTHGENQLKFSPKVILPVHMLQVMVCIALLKVTSAKNYFTWVILCITIKSTNNQNTIKMCSQHAHKSDISWCELSDLSTISKLSG